MITGIVENTSERHAMPSLSISGTNTEIVITAEYRDTFDCDENVLIVRMSAQVYDCHIIFSSMIRLETLEQFHQDIIRLYTDLKGKIRFHPEGDWLDLEGKIDKSGHIYWKGRILYKRDYNLTLRFAFQSDQSYLPDLLDQISQIFQCFPFLG